MDWSGVFDDLFDLADKASTKFFDFQDRALAQKLARQQSAAQRQATLLEAFGPISQAQAAPVGETGLGKWLPMIAAGSALVLLVVVARK